MFENIYVYFFVGEIKMNYNKKDDGFNIDTDINIYSSSSRDISSHSYTDISSSSKRTVDNNQYKKKSSKKKKANKKKKFLKVLVSVLSIFLVLCIAFYAYGYSIINKITRVELDESDLGITTSTYEDVKNIALLGIDSRSDDKSGRADANVILTIDKKHKKIKLTSIARDSYVAIEGHSKDKLTHAYAYGKSQLAVKTLNQNYGLEITDYVTMNFFELARVIDYIGGVVIDVNEAEMGDLNNNVIANTDFGDIECKPIQAPGVQLLSGAQAVCYARIRYVDGDVERGNRQKEVLTAMFASVKKMNPVKLPEVASLVIEECETSLSTNDIISLGTWAIMSSPEFEQLSLPNDNVPGRGQTIGGAWCYVYDIEAAKQEIKDFIFEENNYSTAEIEKKEQQ